MAGFSTFTAQRLKRATPALTSATVPSTYRDIVVRLGHHTDEHIEEDDDVDPAVGTEQDVASGDCDHTVVVFRGLDRLSGVHAKEGEEHGPYKREETASNKVRCCRINIRARTTTLKLRGAWTCRSQPYRYSQQLGRTTTHHIMYIYGYPQRRSSVISAFPLIPSLVITSTCCTRCPSVHGTNCDSAKIFYPRKRVLAGVIT